jgi:hypothetical protein
MGQMTPGNLTGQVGGTLELVRVISIVLAIGAGCGGSDGPDLSGLPACGTSSLLQVSPMGLGDLREIAPLGNLAPPSHTFPADHIYFYPTIGAAVPVISPGAIRIVGATLQKAVADGKPELDDYGLDFYTCADHHFYLLHLVSLAPALESKLGSLASSCDPPYTTNGYTITHCRTTARVDLATADPIGIAGGPTEGALDVGLIDHGSPPLAFVDPKRLDETVLYAACPLDQFAPEVHDAMVAKLAVNGMPRTAAPVCGTVMQDVADTAQGRWYFDDTPEEDHHLALVHQNWDPSIGAFSIGTSVPGVGSTTLTFTPATAGRVNLDFDRVTADGNIYCYELGTMHALVQLVTATQLEIEVVPGATCGDPSTWAFGANAATFVR